MSNLSTTANVAMNEDGVLGEVAPGRDIAAVRAEAGTWQMDGNESPREDVYSDSECESSQDRAPEEDRVTPEICTTLHNINATLHNVADRTLSQESYLNQLEHRMASMELRSVGALGQVTGGTAF